MNTVFNTPFNQCLSLAPCGKQMIRPFVALLLKWCRPFYVAFFVVPFVINAIHGMLHRRTFTKSVSELLKRLKTKLNTTPPVSRVILRGWHGTPHFSVNKNLVSVVSRNRSRFSNHFGTAFCTTLNFQTAARVCPTRQHLSADDQRPLTAVAFTQPQGQELIFLSITALTCVADNVQVAKALVAQIFCVLRREGFSDIISSSHFVYSSIVNNLIRVGRGVSDLYRPVFSIAQSVR